MYGCTEAFLADMKWILHNCIIYNGGRSGMNHTNKENRLVKIVTLIIVMCSHQVITNLQRQQKSL